MGFVLIVFLCVVCTEALTEIIVKSLIFKPFRDWLSTFRGNLWKGVTQVFFCGHCFSVWSALMIVGVLSAFVDLRPPTFSSVPLPVFVFLIVLLVHRLSNFLHMFIDKYVDKYYSASQKAEE